MTSCGSPGPVPTPYNTPVVISASGMITRRPDVVVAAASKIQLGHRFIPVQSVPIGLAASGIERVVADIQFLHRPVILDAIP